METDNELQKTHLAVSEDLVGRVERIQSGHSARVSLTFDSRMRADDRGLIHGGFTFGLADFAAMVAVNDPFVVLLSSQVQFLKPVVTGEKCTAAAEVVETDGKTRKVRCVVVNQDQEKVLEGEFLCRVLNQHVLEKRNRG